MRETSSWLDRRIAAPKFPNRAMAEALESSGADGARRVRHSGFCLIRLPGKSVQVWINIQRCDIFLKSISGKGAVLDHFAKSPFAAYLHDRLRSSLRRTLSKQSVS
jgi:hypothetical protein